MINYDQIMTARFVYKKFYKQNISGEVAFKVKAFLDETAQFEKDFHEEESHLLEQYAKKDEKGKQLVTKNENGNSTTELANSEQFYKELSGFLESEIHYHFDSENFLTRDDFKYITCSPEDISFIANFVID